MLIFLKASSTLALCSSSLKDFRAPTTPPTTAPNGPATAKPAVAPAIPPLAPAKPALVVGSLFCSSVKKLSCAYCNPVPAAIPKAFNPPGNFPPSFSNLPIP